MWKVFEHFVQKWEITLESVINFLTEMVVGGRSSVRRNGWRVMTVIPCGWSRNVSNYDCAFKRRDINTFQSSSIKDARYNSTHGLWRHVFCLCFSNSMIGIGWFSESTELKSAKVEWGKDLMQRTESPIVWVVKGKIKGRRGFRRQAKGGD